jgi:hypothetical protein
VSADEEFVTEYKSLMAQVGEAATSYAGVEIGVSSLFVAFMGSSAEAEVVAEAMGTEPLMKACRKLAALDRYATIQTVLLFALRAASTAGQRRAALVHSMWGLAHNPTGRSVAAIRMSARTGGRPEVITFDEFTTEIRLLDDVGHMLLHCSRLVRGIEEGATDELPKFDDESIQAHDRLVRHWALSPVSSGRQ